MKKKIILPILLICSGVKPGTSDSVDNVIKIGGLVVGGYAIYKFFNWLNYKDTRTLSTRAQSDLENSRNYFGPVIEIVNQHFSPADQATKNGHTLLNENALYAIAMHVEAGQSTYCSNFPGQVESSIKSLSTSKAALEKRHKRVVSGKETDDTFDKAYVDSLIVEMDVFISKMSFLKKLTQHHKGYFENLAMGKKFAERDYPREISIVNAGQYDIQYQMVFCARAKYNDSDYPLMDFVKQARADVSQLATSTRNLPYNYAIVIGAANNLQAQLLRAVELVEASNEYLQEKRDKKNDDLKRERLRVEQEKAEAEARKARAEERKANAEENKAAAEWANVLNPQRTQPVVVIR